MSKEKVLLSVVIPCKNEEKNIERCLRSVLKQAEKFPEAEVMLVDSNSSDDSVEKAASFDIKIIRSRPSWVSTSSAARFLGFLNTHGQYVLVIDADMELLDGFLEKAVRFMEENEDVAGIAGICREVHVMDNNVFGGSENFYERDTEKISEADYLGGAALFRRSCLEPEGAFNPYLYSQEELELCQRLKKKWRLVTLPYPMIIHYTFPDKSIKLFLRQIGSNRFAGMGQLLRCSFGTGLFWKNILRFKKLLVSLVLFIFIVYSILYLILGKNVLGLYAEATALLALYLVLAFKKKSLKQAFLTVCKWLFIIFNFVCGFFFKIKPIDDFPTDVEFVKR